MKQPEYRKSQFCDTQNLFEGETIEREIERLTTEKTPIESVSPQIFTEAKDGVLPECDIRTDRWDIAMEAMDSVAASYRAKRENYQQQRETGDGSNDLSPRGESTQADQQGGETPTE